MTGQIPSGQFLPDSSPPGQYPYTYSSPRVVPSRQFPPTEKHDPDISPPNTLNKNHLLVQKQNSLIEGKHAAALRRQSKQKKFLANSDNKIKRQLKIFDDDEDAERLVTNLASVIQF